MQKKVEQWDSSVLKKDVSKNQRMFLKTNDPSPTQEAQKADQYAASSLMHVLQKGKSKRPFFFLHGIWLGMPLYCFTIARASGREQPFYSFDPWENHTLQPLPSVEQQAATYIRLMRAVQPEGPYLLGGFCNGGLIAYEIAQQLRAGGETVELLVLIDPPALSLYVEIFYQVMQVFGSLLRQNEDQKWLFFLRTRHFIRRLSFYVKASEFRQQRFKEQLLDRDPDFIKLFPSLETLHKEPMALWTWTHEKYKWHPYDGETVVAWCSEEPDIKKRWPKNLITNEIASAMIPGSHTTMVAEYADELARYVSEYIRKANAD